MSDCHEFHTARNGVDKVRNLQRALYRKSKQEKEARFYSLYDKVWRTDVLWAVWRQVKANHGAPGIDGKPIEEMVETGQEEGMIQKLQAALPGALLPVRARPGGRDSQAERGNAAPGHRDSRRSRGADGYEA